MGTFSGPGTTVGDAWGALAHEVWRHVEPYHALVYFAPEHRAACDAIGLRGGWMAYFASRASPMGPVPAGVVAAVFYNFHPAMVARAIPDAWSFSSPEAVLAARYDAVDAMLTRVLDDGLASMEVERAAALAETAARAGDVAGRPLYAANLELDPPEPPHVRLWHATTLLREHRGDGHVSALVSMKIDGCMAHVLQAASGAVPREQLQPFRGWSDDEWAAASERLAQRGWVSPDGGLTEAGRSARAELQATTDALAAAPLRALGIERTRELIELMGPIVARVRAAGDLPFPNPMGVPAD